MSTIEIIKQKILLLDPKSFQDMCLSYLKLERDDLSNPTGLGGKPGTRKTRRGTPDIYFITLENKYIFVECTTQADALFQKIREDIKKCLDKSAIELNKKELIEIICCHTSSSIKPSQDLELRKLCRDSGVRLTLIGIDQFAEDLFSKYPWLAKTHLGLEVDTDQIFFYDSFIEQYNSKKLSAPIHDHFFFREQEIEHIDTAFQLHDIVVLHGVAGAGKTRLALHYAKTHSDKYKMKLLCILSRGLSLYEDLKKHIYRPGDYFLFVDDANELTDLKQIIEYATKTNEGYNVKILLTVRDYTLKNTENTVREIATPYLLPVRIFTDEEIRELLRETLGIVNRRYLDRIVAIAEGNARLAILAGEIARNENRLDSIRDVSNLYDEYFGSVLENYKLFQNDDIGIVAGIVAFLGPSTLAPLYKILPTLLMDRMQEHPFLNCVRKLSNDEILDLFHDTAVKFPDQSLSNYVLKHVFFDKKLIDLSRMIKSSFHRFKNKTIESVNTLLHIFTNDTLIEFVIDAIRKCWDELTKENSPDLSEFIKCFFSVKPTITLMILKGRIESEEETFLSLAEIDVKKGRNIRSVENEIIDVLGGFAKLEQFHIALDLFFDLYLKRPDLYTDFFRAIDLHFSIDEDSVQDGFITQITLLEKVKKSFQNFKDLYDYRKQGYIAVFFFEIAKTFLKLNFQTVKNCRKDSFTLVHFALPSNEATNSYRGLIWDFLLELCSYATYREGVRSVLISYGDEYCENNPEVTQFDAFFINEIILTHFPKEELRNCLLAEKIYRYFERENVSYRFCFGGYFSEPSFYAYRLLTGHDYIEKAQYEELERIREIEISSYIEKDGVAGFNRLVDVCTQLDEWLDSDRYEIRLGLEMALNYLAHNSDSYACAIEYYLRNDTPYCIRPYPLVEKLFRLLPEKEVFDLISSAEYAKKSDWIFAFYHQLPENLITLEHVEALNDFFSNEIPTTSTPQRDLIFLKKYNVIEDAFLKACRIILDRTKQVPILANIYFDSLFFNFLQFPKKLIQTFEKDLELLEQIYFSEPSINNWYDHDGTILKEIYVARPFVLDSYVDEVLGKSDIAIKDSQSRHRCFFDLDNYVAIYNEVFDQLIDKSDYLTGVAARYLETIIQPNGISEELVEKQDQWIEQCIQRESGNSQKMYCLFKAIANAKLGDERHVKYIAFFIQLNQSYDAFEKIPLTPSSYGYSGSGGPLFSRWVCFLKSLLSNFQEVNLLRHAHHIENIINHFQERIESEKIREFIGQ